MCNAHDMPTLTIKIKSLKLSACMAGWLVRHKAKGERRKPCGVSADGNVKSILTPVVATEYGYATQSTLNVPHLILIVSVRQLLHHISSDPLWDLSLSCGCHRIHIHCSINLVHSSWSRLLCPARVFYRQTYNYLLTFICKFGWQNSNYIGIINLL